jgi:hypothetical protein
MPTGEFKPDRWSVAGKDESGGKTPPKTRRAAPRGSHGLPQTPPAGVRIVFAGPPLTTKDIHPLSPDGASKKTGPAQSDMRELYAENRKLSAGTFGKGPIYCSVNRESGEVIYRASHGGEFTPARNSGYTSDGNGKKSPSPIKLPPESYIHVRGDGSYYITDRSGNIATLN